MTFRPFARGSAFLGCLLALAFGVIDARGATNATPATKLRAPTALWNAYPLKPRRLAAERTALRLPLRQVTKPVAAMTPAQSKSAFVLLLLAMMIMLSSALALKPGLVSMRVGGSERETRVRRRRPASRPPRPKRPRRRPQAQPTQTEEPRVIRLPLQSSPTTKACEIKLWRGVTKCQLVATVSESDEVIAISRTFSKCEDEAPTTEALLALTKLREFVERYGWSVARGPHWYQ